MSEAPSVSPTKTSERRKVGEFTCPACAESGVTHRYALYAGKNKVTGACDRITDTLGKNGKPIKCGHLSVLTEAQSRRILAGDMPAPSITHAKEDLPMPEKIELDDEELAKIKAEREAKKKRAADEAEFEEWRKQKNAGNKPADKPAGDSKPKRRGLFYWDPNEA